MIGKFGSQITDSKITVSMISDALDLAGLRNQTLDLRLQSVKPGLRAFGYARTARFFATDQVDPIDPYGAVIDYIDGTMPGDFLAVETGESNVSAFWGELFSAAALGRSAVGMVTDGNIRDVDKVAQLGFPAFSRSSRPVDFRGRMVLDATQILVKIGGVQIAPGDFIAADDDGIAVVPIASHETVLTLARARARTESVVLEELLDGSSLRGVWDRHGML
jgi:regulator of RNase E activity RraA